MSRDLPRSASDHRRPPPDVEGTPEGAAVAVPEGETVGRESVSGNHLFRRRTPSSTGAKPPRSPPPWISLHRSARHLGTLAPLPTLRDAAGAVPCSSNPWRTGWRQISSTLLRAHSIIAVDDHQDRKKQGPGGMATGRICFEDSQSIDSKDEVSR